jgi:hypothetical protein
VAVRRRVLRRLLAERERLERRCFLPLEPLEPERLERRCFLPLEPLEPERERLERRCFLPLEPLEPERERDRDLDLLRRLLRFLHRLGRDEGLLLRRVDDGLRHFLVRCSACTALEAGEPLMMLATNAAAYFLPLYITILPLEPDRDRDPDRERERLVCLDRDLERDPAILGSGGGYLQWAGQ